MRVLPKELFVCSPCAKGLVFDSWPKGFPPNYTNPDPYEGSRGQVVYATSVNADRVPPHKTVNAMTPMGYMTIKSLEKEKGCPCCQDSIPLAHGFWTALTMLAVE